MITILISVSLRHAECRPDTPPKIYSFSTENKKYEFKNESEPQTTINTTIEDSKMEKAAEEMLRSTMTHVKMAMVKIKDAYVKKMKKITVAEVINTIFDNVVEIFDENTPLSSPSAPESEKAYVQEVPQISRPQYAGSLYNKDVLELLDEFRMNVGNSENRLSKDDVDIKLESRKDIDDENKSASELTITVQNEATTKLEVTTISAVLSPTEGIEKKLESSTDPRERRSNSWELGEQSEEYFYYN